MTTMLEFFRLDEAVPLIMLIAMLRFVGTQLGANDPLIERIARGVAAVGFLGFVAGAIEIVRPVTPSQWLGLTVRAIFAMGMAHSLARVLLPVLVFLYLHLVKKPAEAHRVWAEQEQRRVEMAAEEQQRQAVRTAAEVHGEQLRHHREAVEHQRRDEEARRPPPPTREEKAAALKQRYDQGIEMLRAVPLDDIERHAAHEKLKQQYLRDLDGLLP
jgi:hypothetical protein